LIVHSNQIERASLPHQLGIFVAQQLHSETIK
jgi:hypothetical protein